MEWIKEDVIIGESRGYCRGEDEGKMGQDLRGELSEAQRDADDSGVSAVKDLTMGSSEHCQAS